MRITLLMTLLVVRVWAASAPDFTIVALPDTQKYAAKNPAIFRAQVDWISAQRTDLNIVYVAGLGDIVDDGDRKTNQWTVATNCLYRLLDAQIPLGVVPGNHDHYGGVACYDACLGLSVFTNRPWFGGALGDNNRNHYDLFSVGNLDFVILYLDFYKPSDDYRAADAWATGVLKSNANRRAIVVSHDILATTGEFDPRGQVIYDNVKTHTNVCLMLCGHNHGEAARADTFAGNTIYSVLTDYQSWTNGGDGFLRLYRFSPKDNVIRAQTYSPTLNQWRTDKSAEFTIPYHMNPDVLLAPLSPFAVLSNPLNIKPAPKAPEK